MVRTMRNLEGEEVKESRADSRVGRSARRLVRRVVMSSAILWIVVWGGELGMGVEWRWGDARSDVISGRVQDGRESCS